MFTRQSYNIPLVTRGILHPDQSERMEGCRPNLVSTDDSLTFRPRSLSIELPEDRQTHERSNSARAWLGPRSSFKVPAPLLSCRARLQRVHSAVQIHSAVWPVTDAEPRTPLHRALACVPRPVGLSFDGYERGAPSNGASTPGRRRLSVTFERRHTTRRHATKTVISIDVGLFQLMLLLACLSTCSSYVLSAASRIGAMRVRLPSSQGQGGEPYEEGGRSFALSSGADSALFLMPASRVRAVRP